MGVKAIFYVNEVAETATGSGRVKLNATTKGDYAAWAKYTPAGTIEVVSLNEHATQWFRDNLGKDVAITFEVPTEADLIH